MKLTLTNYKDVIPVNDQSLIESLLIDLSEYNAKLDSHNLPSLQLYIDYINEHTEYSEERVDPCPDFYGMYQLISEQKPNTIIGLPMNTDELDNSLCILINLIDII